MLYKAKRNIVYAGKLFEKNKEYELNDEELEQVGVDFEAVGNAEPEKKETKKEPAKDKDEGTDAENPEKEKKAKRK